MKKKQKRNYVIIALLIILLALAIGYAAFSQTLTISGTATGTGTWNVHFTEEATISPSGHSVKGPQVTNDTITVDDLTLGYPGDGCTLTVNIKNEGSLAAKLTSLEILDSDGMTPFSNSDITITAPSIEGETLAAGETCPVTIAIAWNEDSTATSATAGFKVKFTYDQSNEAVTVTPDHGSHTSN